jgi:hypothetical protein
MLLRDHCYLIGPSLTGDGRPATFAYQAINSAFAELTLLSASQGREKMGADDSVRCNTHFLSATMLLGEAAATARGATVIIGEPAIEKNVQEISTTSVA